MTNENIPKALAATAVALRNPLFLIQDEFHTRPGGSPSLGNIKGCIEMKKEEQKAHYEV